MKSFIAPAPVSAFPHVGGQTIRFKAEPAKLTGVALRVMAASGNFGYPRSAAPSKAGLWFGAVAVLMAAGAIAIAGGGALTSDRSSAHVQAVVTKAPPAQVESQDAEEPVLAEAPVTPSETVTKTAPVQARASELNSQDRFEIDRFHHRATAAIGDLAPAAGPAPR